MLCLAAVLHPVTVQPTRSAMAVRARHAGSFGVAPAGGQDLHQLKGCECQGGSAGTLGCFFHGPAGAAWPPVLGKQLALGVVHCVFCVASSAGGM